MNHVDKPSKSLSSVQISGQSPKTFKPPAPLPRIQSATDGFITSEVYELCDSTPAEQAAAEALRKKGPPPKRPVPYQKSHSLDRNVRYDVPRSSKSSSSDLDSSPGSPLQEAPSTKPLKPPPRRKHSIHKPRNNKQPT